jgi:hypothetical protein
MHTLNIYGRKLELIGGDSVWITVIFKKRRRKVAGFFSHMEGDRCVVRVQDRVGGVVRIKVSPHLVEYR